MSATPMRRVDETPSPTKRLTPVVEIPVIRTRSLAKRMSAHTTSGTPPSAKRQRQEDSITGSSRILTDGGSPTMHSERMLQASEVSSKTVQQGRELWPTQAIGSTSKLPPPAVSSAKKAFTLPGQERATRKKLGKVNDLLSGVSSKTIDFGFDAHDDVGNDKEAKSDSRTAKDTSPRFDSTSTLDFMDPDRIKTAEHASLPTASRDISLQVDGELPPQVEGPEVSHRSPPPVPSTSTTVSPSQTANQPTQSTQTPTKQRRIAQLVTPTSSSKKRTPTKAVKRKVEDDVNFLSAPNPSFDIFPTPSTTPERSPRHETLYPAKDIVSILQKVVEQLSSPCWSVSVPENINVTDSGYKSWLASQPCLSPAHAAAEKDVRNTLDRTIRDGEGNCMLVIGERGIGKSAIIDRSLKTLEGVYGKNAFLTVKLSGLVQRDDKAAVREIARQLCSSSYSEDIEEGSSFNSNANILSSLLAILEPGQSDDPEEAANKSKPIIFIIDEFDLFAHSAVRQSMLYCLLDCVQGGFRRGGMAVCGLSARADCFESLEKRVKSRCQSRVHHILPAEERFAGPPVRAKEALLLGESQTAITREWNDSIETFFSDKTVQMQFEAMADLRGLDADRRLFDILTLLIAKRIKGLARGNDELSAPLPVLRAFDLSANIQSAERGIPPSLNMVEFALLIACKHLTEEEKPVNFVIAYERYVDHCKRAAASGSSSSRAFSRGLCLRAFESLKKLGLVREVYSAGKQAIGGGSIFRLCRLVPWPFMIEEAVKSRKDIPQHLAKWCKAWSD